MGKEEAKEKLRDRINIYLRSLNIGGGVFDLSVSRSLDVSLLIYLSLVGVDKFFKDSLDIYLREAGGRSNTWEEMRDIVKILGEDIE